MKELIKNLEELNRKAEKGGGQHPGAGQGDHGPQRGLFLYRGGGGGLAGSPLPTGLALAGQMPPNAFGNVGEKSRYACSPPLQECTYILKRAFSSTSCHGFTPCFN